ncbi:unnamed protein product, partial [Didymodactylos carnosus]
MNQFDGDILIKYSSFDAFAKVYLYKQEVSGNNDYHTFDRRHFEYIWLLYKAATSMFKRHIHSIPISLECDLDIFLWNSLNDELKAFCDRWSRHKDDNPWEDDCSELIVIDGHPNCTRRVCATVDAELHCTELGDSHFVSGFNFHISLVY